MNNIQIIIATVGGATGFFLALEWWASFLRAKGFNRWVDGIGFLYSCLLMGFAFGVAAAL